MAARLQLTLAAALALVALGLGGVLLFAGDDAGGTSVSDSSLVGPTGWAGSQSPPDVPANDFRLTDQDGWPTSLRALRGQVVVLTFQYATCRDSCPILTQQIRGALDQVGKDVPVLAISVDPENDNPRTARAFVLKQRMTGRMRFLLGDRAQLAPIWKAYGIQEQGKDFEHSAYVLLLDRAGKRRVSFPIGGLTPEGLAHDLRRLLAEKS